MGNRFGNYPSVAAAEAELELKGFVAFQTIFGETWYKKASTDNWGNPCVAMVRIVEQFVSGEYTASGKDEPYWQHEYIPL